MSAPKKYRPGDRIESLTEAVEAIMRGEYIFLEGSLIHPSFARNWRLDYLRCAYPDLSRAIVTDEWLAWREALRTVD